MRWMAALGWLLGVGLIGLTPVGAAAADPPPRWIAAPAPGGEFPLTRYLESRGYTRLPAGTAAPSGSVRIWGKGNAIAHSSVVARPDQQVEMGDKPGGSRYVSALLPPKQDPTPNVGAYTLLETWRPPAGAVVDLTRLEQLVGLDREYDSPTARWNCHGFSANVVHACVRTTGDVRDDAWVAWYAEKIGYQPVYVTTFAGFRREERSANFAGGGIDPRVVLEKTFIAGPFATREEATAAVLGRMRNFRRLSGIYAGLPVADMMGRVHNITNLRVDPTYFQQPPR